MTLFLLECLESESGNWCGGGFSAKKTVPWKKYKMIKVENECNAEMVVAARNVCLVLMLLISIHIFMFNICFIGIIGSIIITYYYQVLDWVSKKNRIEGKTGKT